MCQRSRPNLLWPSTQTPTTHATGSGTCSTGKRARAYTLPGIREEDLSPSIPRNGKGRNNNPGGDVNINSRPESVESGLGTRAPYSPTAKRHRTAAPGEQSTSRDLRVRPIKSSKSLLSRFKVTRPRALDPNTQKGTRKPRSKLVA